MKSKYQISESIELGIILAMAGGFMDAYSYMCRDMVFANAQTGNMILFGINLSSGNYKAAVRYFFPVLAFAVGIILSDIVRLSLKDKNLLHWRQISIIFEILVMVSVGFMPQGFNLLANCLTSLACGIQVESFRKVHGNGIATTMCVGNLRSATNNISEYFYTKDKKFLKRAFLYFAIIIFFIIGAIIGNFFVELIREKAVFICCGILLLAFIIMFIDRENAKALSK